MKAAKGSNRGRPAKGVAYQYRTNFIDEEGFPLRLLIEKWKVEYRKQSSGPPRMVSELLPPATKSRLHPGARALIELYFFEKNGLLPSGAGEAFKVEIDQLLDDWFKRLFWGEDPRTVFATNPVGWEFPGTPASVQPTDHEFEIWDRYQAAMAVRPGQRKPTGKAARSRVASSFAQEGRPIDPDTTVADAVKKVDQFLAGGGSRKGKKKRGKKLRN
ncbi:MAG: hypothetical protein IT492_19375 [Gammaproteobacteria bacterium]|nr:hypothetical protein [Gammaproteobacteria bacterium]